MVKTSERKSILAGLKAGEPILEQNDQTKDAAGKKAEEIPQVNNIEGGSGGSDPTTVFGERELGTVGDGDGGTDPDAPYGRKADGTPYLRKPSGKRKPRGQNKKTTESLDVTAKALMLLHATISGVTGHAHWVQSEDEAKAQAKAIEELQSVYDLEIDPKQAAWLNIAVVVGVPLGMRAYTSMTLMQKEMVKEVKSNAEEPKKVAPKKAQSQKPAYSTPSEMNAFNGGSVFDAAG